MIYTNLYHLVPRIFPMFLELPEQFEIESNCTTHVLESTLKLSPRRPLISTNMSCVDVVITVKDEVRRRKGMSKTESMILNFCLSCEAEERKKGCTFEA